MWLLLFAFVLLLFFPPNLTFVLVNRELNRLFTPHTLAVSHSLLREFKFVVREPVQHPIRQCLEFS